MPLRRHYVIKVFQVLSSANTSSRAKGTLLSEARHGSKDALGRLINDCRDYLLLVAIKELPNEIRQKVAASDLVQQTLVEACEDFDRFAGGTDAEFRAWLRRILLNNLLDATRGFRTAGKRDVRREVPLDFDEPKNALFNQLTADDSSPSACAIAAEEQILLAQAIDRLPPHYARIIRLRNLDFKSFVEIGMQMQLTADSARKLWERAIHQLAGKMSPRQRGQ